MILPCAIGPATGTAESPTVTVAGHRNIQILWEASASAYAARNQGIRKSKGLTLAFADATCFVAPDWLAQIAEAMQP